MAREKKPPAGVPEWILTYGDMMSLLLCFFIMLYAISTIEIPKIQAAIESLREGFGYRALSMTPTSRHANAKQQRINSTARAKRQDVLRGGQPVSAPQGDNPQVQTVRSSEETIQGGVIRFEFRSDELNEQAMRDLDTIYDQLAGSPYKIKIKGHASIDERGTYRLADDRAYARTVNVREYLVEKGINRRHFEIAQVGPFEPLPQRSVAEQANPQLANSFVEVMLLNTYPRDSEGDQDERNLKYSDDVPIR